MSRPIGRRAALAAAPGALLLLAACGTDRDAPAEQDQAAQLGYVSGDGTLTEWTPDERGEPVELAGVSMAGDPIDVADWRGQVVVLNFWYAACPPCRKEAPDLAAIAREYEPDGVQFLGINHTDEPATAQAFERRFDIPFPSLHDSDAAGVAAMQGQVPLNAVPTTIVLDTDGRIAARIIGIAEPGILRPMIEQTLDARPLT